MRKRKNEIVNKNLELHREWMRYVLEHPEILDKMPKGAQLILIPKNDSELAKENEKLLKKSINQGIPAMVVYLDLPKPPSPRIKVIPAHH
jgi:hypothetical protein